MSEAVKAKKTPMSAAPAAAKIIRVVTVAPLMALVLFTVLFIRGGVFGSTAQYIVSAFFLTLLPLSAYPLQRVLPSFRDRGRDGQRTLAMIMANVGYIMSIIYAIVFSIDGSLLVLYLTYLFSGAAILIINKVIGFRASGHACGLAGPGAALIYFTGWAGLIPTAVFFVLMVWGSLVMKRHTPVQLAVGSAVPVVIFLTLAALML